MVRQCFKLKNRFGQNCTNNHLFACQNCSSNPHLGFGPIYQIWNPWLLPLLVCAIFLMEWGLFLQKGGCAFNSQKIFITWILKIYLAQLELNLNSNFPQKVYFFQFYTKIKCFLICRYHEVLILATKININIQNFDIQFLSKTAEISTLSQKWEGFLLTDVLQDNPILIKFWLWCVPRSLCKMHSECAFKVCNIWFFLKLGENLCQSCQRPTPIGHCWYMYMACQ